MSYRTSVTDFNSLFISVMVEKFMHCRSLAVIFSIELLRI